MNDIKVVLVFSRINYIPNNYIGILEELVANNRYVSSVIFLDNLDFNLIKLWIGLLYFRAWNLFFQLSKNIFSSVLFDKRLRLLNKKNIQYMFFKSMNDLETINYVKDINIDLILNLRTRDIYKKNILSIPKIGCINIHHGLLPKYKGVMCDLHALSENREAGFSIHQMNEKIDDGLIFKTYVVSNGDHKDYVKYLELGSHKEGIELLALLNKINKEKKMPKGIVNISKDSVYTKVPNLDLIKYFKKKGIVL